MTRPIGPGDEVVRMAERWTVIEAGDPMLLAGRTHDRDDPVEVSARRFREELDSDRAEARPKCRRCGLAQNPNDGPERGICYECWFQNATLASRAATEIKRNGPYSHMAAEAARADDPREHLLNAISDPVRPLHERSEAEHLLSGEVSIPELSAARAQCPACSNEEQFRVSPDDGSVACPCGEQLLPPEDER